MRVQLVDVLGRLLEALVLLQAAHQLGARIVLVLAVRAGGRGSSMRDLISASIAAISRYSPASSSCRSAITLDVLHVLARDLGDRDVEDVEVLAADQVQQQVERAFERLQEHLQRIRRDVQVARQLA